ncbi:ABC transporter ATP-binding protein [Oleiphilus messinensis]
MPHPDTTSSSSERAAPLSWRNVRGYQWRDLLPMVLEHRRELIKANLIAILATLAAVPVPLLLPLLVDEILLHEPGPVTPIIDAMTPVYWHGPVLYILAMLLFVLILRLASLGFNVLQAQEFAIISKDIIYKIRSRMLVRLKHISMAEYETVGSGSVASRFVTDLDTLDQFIGASISRFLVAVFTLVGTSAVLLWMHWQLALVILLFNPMVIYFTTVIGKKVKHLKRQENKAYEVFQQALTETLDAIHQIRAANRERHYMARLTDRARGVRDHSIHYAWKSDAANRVSFMLFQFGVDVFRGAAILTVLFSDLSIGYMFAVFGYLWFMMAPVQEVLGIQYSYYAAKAALARINQLFELKQEPYFPPQVNPFVGKTTVSVHIEDIHFAYGDGSDVLSGVTLDIAAGEKVALVGASGGGKSTLVQVILGMYAPTRGQVYFDGIPVTKIGMNVVRENVATVLQHPALFNDSIRNNLGLGREFSDEDYWHALKVAQLHDTIQAMPRQLDTIVGRQGIRLSGGQRQRLAIARMVLANPAVVILDEATSALDADTEYNLHEALRDFLQTRTTLIIAHRLSSVKQADRVYVFEDGKVAETGRHEELIQQGGLYAQLYGERQN